MSRYFIINFHSLLYSASCTLFHLPFLKLSCCNEILVEHKQQIYKRIKQKEEKRKKEKAIDDVIICVAGAADADADAAVAFTNAVRTS